MKICIISDIHDNLINLKKCLAWCRENKVDKIICCGDVCNFETLKHLAHDFPREIILVRGNMEIYEEGEEGQFNNFNYLGRFGRTELGNHNIGICHEPFFIEQVLKRGECDLIFYGHTHKPWIESKIGIRIVNPGTLGGVFQKATFAMWDTKNDVVELKILEKL